MEDTAFGQLGKDIISLVELAEVGKWAEAETLHSKAMDEISLLMGSPEKLEIILRELLHLAQLMLPEESAERLISIKNLADVLQKQGNWQEAEKMHREVLEVRRRVLGEDHPDTLTSMNNLATVFSDQGKWKEAEEMHREVLEFRRRVLGEDHQDTLTSMNNLANGFYLQGKWEKAEKNAQRSARSSSPSSRGRPSKHADQHEQPCHCFLRSRQVAGS